MFYKNSYFYLLVIFIGIAAPMQVAAENNPQEPVASANNAAVNNAVVNAFVVNGIVQNSASEPLGGIVITVKKGITDITKFTTKQDGTFNFKFTEKGFYSLIFVSKSLPSKIILLNIDGVSTPEKQVVRLSEATRLQAVVVKKKNTIKQSEKQALGVTVIDENSLQNAAINDSTDLSGSAGNLHTIDTGSSISTYFGLRGITSINSIDPLIVFYIDGVAQFQTASTPLQLVNLQSISVYKGAQTTIYGRNAFAGVIDIQTKRQPSRFSGNASIAADSILNHSYMLNIAFPILKRYIFAKFGGYFSMGDGAVWNDTLQERVDGHLNFNIYGTLDFYPIDALQLSFSGKYEASDEEPFPYVGSGVTYQQNAETAFLYPYNVDYETKNTNERHVGEVINKINFTSDYFNFTSATLYQKFLNELVLDTDFSSDNTSKVAINADADLVANETKFTSSVETEKYFSWLVGTYLYWFLQDTNTTINIKPNLTPNQAFDESKLVAWQQNIGFAMFVNFVFPLHSRIALILGGRVDIDTKETMVTKNNFTGSTKVFTNTFNKEKLDYFFTPKVAFNFLLGNKATAYASVTRGYRNGGMNNFVNSEENIFFDAEYSWQSELGAKIKDEDLSFDFAFFYTYWEKQQLNVFFEGDFFQFGLVNAESSHSFGAEWEAKIPLFYGLSYTVIFGFAKSSFLGLTSQTGDDLKGKLQPFVPSNTMLNALQHTYQLEIGKVLISHTNRLEHKYTSHIYYNPENTVKANGYHLLNFTSNLRIYNVMLTMWFKNILDKKYVGFSLPFGGIIPVRLADPFRFGGKISVYF